MITEMKKIITYAELLQRMQPNLKTGYDFDYISRQIVVTWLRQNAAKFNIAEVTETSGRNPADIIVKLTNDKCIAVECKDRQFPSTQYGDCVVEDIKIQSLRRHIQKGEYARAHLITLFSDGVMAIAPDIQAEHTDSRVQTSLCNYQTMVNPQARYKTEKNLVSFQQSLKYYFAFALDDNGKYSIIFETEPINFQKVSTQLNSVQLF